MKTSEVFMKPIGGTECVKRRLLHAENMLMKEVS